MAPHGVDLREVAIRLFTFPKARHVRSRRDFLRAQQHGVRVHTTHFVLVIAKTPTVGLRASRLGVTVTKKAFATAVARNRVKRLVREAFRRSPSLLPAGVDLLVIAKQGADQLGLANVLGEWTSVSGLIDRRVRELGKAIP